MVKQHSKIILPVLLVLLWFTGIVSAEVVHVVPVKASADGDGPVCGKGHQEREAKGRFDHIGNRQCRRSGRCGLSH